MFKKLRNSLATASKETVKEELKQHAPEIIQGITLILLAYICIKVNGKPVNVTVNVNGHGSFL